MPFAILPRNFVSLAQGCGLRSHISNARCGAPCADVAEILCLAQNDGVEVCYTLKPIPYALPLKRGAAVVGLVAYYFSSAVAGYYEGFCW
jgi:hypothetical protein